jgi:2-keto-4-pentenoate hydratase/2-oxohepta-3-ene-1,7-dioic acid hydratase in catechol pathway
MRLATVQDERGEIPVLVDPRRGVAAVADLMPEHSGDAMALLSEGRAGRLAGLAEAAPAAVFRPEASVRFTAPYRRPRKIWGIGLNYVAHAADLTESVPDEPASFMKGDHTIIGPEDPIPLPSQSERVTAEAELGLVIGRLCRNVKPEDAIDHVFGVCPVLDQTAEDILARNPRFLTRSKNFPGLLSFGPTIVPLAEVIAANGGLADIEVSTVRNGEVHRRNTVAHMRFDPAFLVSFHSKVMPLFPGDIICTGTPGAVVVRPGDVAECRIEGIGTLRNPVVAG